MNTKTKPTLKHDGPEVNVAGLIHRVREPETTGPHPTVVMLHGRSGTEDVMWVFANALPPNWLAVAPRGLKPDPDGGFAWHPRTPDEWPCLYEFEPAVQAVTRFIHALPQLYDADPRHTYLMGFSQGAATAYALAMTYPKLIRGVAGLVGFAPEACDAAVQIQALDELPIFMAVGLQDPLIPLARAQTCAATLAAAGAALTYREYDTAHRLNAAAMRDLEAWWRVVSRREP